MVFEMLLNSDIQKKIFKCFTYLNDFTLSKGKKCSHVHFFKLN